MNKERDLNSDGNDKPDPNEDSLDEDTLRRAFELSPPENQGLIYSIYYSLVLEELLEEGKIASYRQTEQYSIDDTKGIDFWITTLEGDLIPMSITGSRSDKSRRLKKHPEIPTIHVRKNLYKKGLKTGMRTRSMTILKDETMEKIEEYLNDEDDIEESGL